MGSKALIAAGVVVVLLVTGWFFLCRPRSSSGSFAAVWQSDLREGLFVVTDPQAAHRLLDEWRWRVGPDASVFRVTVFGDLFIQMPDGRIRWLDTGTGRYVEAATSEEGWRHAAEVYGSEWFHWTTLRELRSLGVELAEGQVYSWRLEPLLGGAETPDNVDLVPLEVHVSQAARLARAAQDLPAGAKVEGVEFEVLGPRDGDWKRTGPGGEDVTIYEVVVNEEMQYSIWPSGEALPSGWKSAGKTGTRDECLEYITEVWTDLRPLSVRKKMEGGERESQR